MTKQPEALFLADSLEGLGAEIFLTHWTEDLNASVNELRRLHEVNAELLAALKNLIVRYQGKKQGVWGESTPEMLSARAAVLKANGVTE
tara:strand:- start:78 stop:344 length:267 start_codon:yes stop_codon:yes gene_type:complete